MRNVLILLVMLLTALHGQIYCQGCGRGESYHYKPFSQTYPTRKYFINDDKDTILEIAYVQQSDSVLHTYFLRKEKNSYTSFYANGNVKEEGCFKHRKYGLSRLFSRGKKYSREKNGVWITYEEDGGVMKTEKYKNGKEIE